MDHLGHHRAVRGIRRRGDRGDARRRTRDAPDRACTVALGSRAAQRRGAPCRGDRRPGQLHDRTGRGAQCVAGSSVRAALRRLRGPRRPGTRTGLEGRSAGRPARRAGQEQPSVAAHRVHQPHPFRELRLGVRGTALRLGSGRTLQRAQPAPRPRRELRRRALLQRHHVQHGEGGGARRGLAGFLRMPRCGGAGHQRTDGERHCLRRAEAVSQPPPGASNASAATARARSRSQQGRPFERPDGRCTQELRCPRSEDRAACRGSFRAAERPPARDRRGSDQGAHPGGTPGSRHFRS